MKKVETGRPQIGHLFFDARRLHGLRRRRGLLLAGRLWGRLLLCRFKQREVRGRMTNL
jgi:hypothetical protein